MAHDALHGQGHLVLERGQLRGLILEDGGNGVGNGFAVEGALAAEHFVKNGAEAEQVAALVHRFAADLLRRHVAGRAQHHSHDGGQSVGVAAGHLRRARQLSHAKIQDFYPALAGNKQVLRLEIAMHEVLLVRCHQAARNLRRKIHGGADRQRSRRLQALPQRHSFQQFGNNVGRALMPADVVDGQNVRVVELGRGARLLLEAP